VLSRRRILVFGPLLLLFLAAAAYFGWLALQVRGELAEAQDSAQELRTAMREQDQAGQQDAVRELQESSSHAADLTDGTSWSVLAHAPLVGDDATGIRALSQSLDGLSRDGIDPLLRSVDMVDRLTADGKIDVEVARGLERPVGQAQSAFTEAARPVEGLDSSGYAGSVKSRFDEYVDIVRAGRDSLASAETASKVLPGMVGSEGPRDYLLVFQNNAELRATGGLPGSWSLVHADEGELSIRRQGAGSDFPQQPEPILPLSDAELEVYDEPLGTFFADAGFTPDFPRAAELMEAHWDAKYPATDLDGVIALDPVALSYLLEGTGPVRTLGGRTLTAETAVPLLLNEIYAQLPDPLQQDVFFSAAARSVFDAVTSGVGEPRALLDGLTRAASEGRVLVWSRHDGEQEVLGDTTVGGGIDPEEETVPRVGVHLNAAAPYKLDYFLDHEASLESVRCQADRQYLRMRLDLASRVPKDVASLPAYVAPEVPFFGKGTIVDTLYVFAPRGGYVDRVLIDGEDRSSTERRELDGHAVTVHTLAIEPGDDREVVVDLVTGREQVDDPELRVTPGVRGDGVGEVGGSSC
jgi:hypothetical protein